MKAIIRFLKAKLLWAAREMRAALPALLQAAANCWQAYAMKDPRLILRILYGRGCPIVLINKSYFGGFPRLWLREYPAITSRRPASFIRIKPADVEAVLQRHGVDHRFGFGDMLVIGPRRRARANLRAEHIVRRLRAAGCWLLTVEDAKTILEGRIAANVHSLSLNLGNRWLTPVEDIAGHAGIDGSLFAFCELTISAGIPCIIAYTPGLPKAFRLWRLSLHHIAVRAPKIG